jgi:hypothetical protein
VPQRPNWAPESIDIDRPSVARMYDYFLGGSHNFAADRQLAEQALSVFPDAPHIVRANRAFLERAVHYLCAAGIDQFLDLGSGIPTAGNVHEIVLAANPSARTMCGASGNTLSACSANCRSAAKLCEPPRK